MPWDGDALWVTDLYTDPYSYSYGDGDIYDHAQCYTNGNGYGHADVHAYSYGYGYIYDRAECYTNGYSYDDIDGYSYCHDHAQRYGNSDSYSYCKTDAHRSARRNTKATSESGTSPKSVAAWRLARIRFANALRTTRSTLVDRPLLKTMAEKSPKVLTNEKQPMWLDSHDRSNHVRDRSTN